MNSATSEPWKFKSGFFEGEKPAALILRGFYPIIYDLFKRVNQKKLEHKNMLHQDLEFIFTKLKNKKPTQICPYCHRASISYFFIRDIGNGFDKLNINQIYCRQCKLDMYGPNKWRSLRRISFKAYHYQPGKRYQQPLTNYYNNLWLLIKAAYEIPDKATEEFIFNFFGYKTKKVKVKQGCLI